MYESDDPRSALATAGARPQAAPIQSDRAFGASTYAKFYETEPQISDDKAKTWLTRGQNFIIAYTQADDGAVLERQGQVDEYVLLLPEAETSVTLTANGETREIGGFTITMVPPGDSKIVVTKGGPVYRLLTTQSADLAAQVSNPEKYVGTHPQIPAFKPWPDPVGGFKIRSYSLDVPAQEGRFGKLFRCTTFMVNVFEPAGPRDMNKLSPHHHDDFEQCSLATGGTWTHFLRWPWTAKLSDWVKDEIETVGSPSVTVIPPKVIHTSAGVAPGDGENLLVDIFSPPRFDFSKMDGWVLNANEYPMPAEN